ncbi:MAG: hypothetical protein OWU32_02905 [Firmicutes bacterium]|nr:hypothetical protein [Bacillota bacterium]
MQRAMWLLMGALMVVLFVYTFFLSPTWGNISVLTDLLRVSS